MKLTNKVQVKNTQGLHTRPATVIVKLLQNCKSTVTFTHKKESVNAKSILSLLLLAAKKNSRINITVDGEDAAEIMDRLVAAFNSGFGEIVK